MAQNFPVVRHTIHEHAGGGCRSDCCARCVKDCMSSVAAATSSATCAADGGVAGQSRWWCRRATLACFHSFIVKAKQSLLHNGQRSDDLYIGSACHSELQPCAVPPGIVRTKSNAAPCHAYDRAYEQGRKMPARRTEKTQTFFSRVCRCVELRQVRGSPWRRFPLALWRDTTKERKHLHHRLHHHQCQGHPHWS